MGEVIEFPSAAKPGDLPAATNLQHDPYYRFIRTVLTTVDACGFAMPLSLESAAERVYRKTRDSSQLARLLRDAR